MLCLGLDRLLAVGPPNPLDAQAWEEIQRLYGSLALQGLPPGLGGPIPGVMPQDLMQRERERLGAFFDLFVKNS